MNDNLNCLKKKLFVLFLLVFLLFSSISFASNMNDLQEAIRKNKIEDINSAINELKVTNK